MKTNTRCLLTVITICIASPILFFSCGNKDASILAAIGTKKTDMKEMSGITASVDKGVVTLSGEYANADSKLNIRKGPGTNQPIVGKAAHNATVVLVSKTNDQWWLIRTDMGEEGYAYAQYLSSQS